MSFYRAGMTLKIRKLKPMLKNLKLLFKNMKIPNKKTIENTYKKISKLF